MPEAAVQLLISWQITEWKVIDSGIALLCMHAPYEVSSKADIYEAVKGYRAFLANA